MAPTPQSSQAGRRLLRCILCVMIVMMVVCVRVCVQAAAASVRADADAAEQGLEIEVERLRSQASQALASQQQAEAARWGPFPMSCTKLQPDGHRLACAAVDTSLHQLCARDCYTAAMDAHSLDWRWAHGWMGE